MSSVTAAPSVPGEVVDLGASAVVGGAGVQVDVGAVGRDGDGGVLVEVVGQVAQAGDEGLRGWRGRWCRT